MRKAATKGVIWAKKELTATRYESYSDQKRNLVIFNAGHHSAISLMIAIRMSKHREDYAILLTIPREDMPGLSYSFCNEGIFDHVITYKDDVITKINSDFEKHITEYFEEVLGPFKNDIDKSICYVSADQIDLFGAYLLNRSKTFFVNELCTNQFVSSWRGKSLLNLGRISKEYFEFQSKSGVINGTNDLVRPIYFKGTSKYPVRIKPEDGFTYDYMELLDDLSDEDKGSILSAFSIGGLRFDNGVQLILLNRLTNIADNSSYSVYEAPYVYQTVIEYFGNKNLATIIKPHPNDTTNISNKFNNATVLERFFPIELLRLCENMRIRQTIGLYTSASERISDIVDENITLGQIYLKICPFIHSLYYTLPLISKSDFIPRMLFTGLTDSPTDEVDFFKKFAVNFNLDPDIDVKPISSYKGEKDSILLTKGDTKECDNSSVQIILSAELKSLNKLYETDFCVSVTLKNKDEWFVWKNETQTNRIVSNSKLNILSHDEKIYLESCGADLEVRILDISNNEFVC